MKLRNKKRRCEKPKRQINKNKKDIYEFIGIPSDVISNEPKIVVVGDYLIDFYNHRGIIDLTETQIKINTKKAIYDINGVDLFICEMTDDKITIAGKVISITRE